MGKHYIIYINLKAMIIANTDKEKFCACSNLSLNADLLKICLLGFIVAIDINVSVWRKIRTHF